jgi:hypothetical protein
MVSISICSIGAIGVAGISERIELIHDWKSRRESGLKQRGSNRTVSDFFLSRCGARLSHGQSPQVV